MSNSDSAVYQIPLPIYPDFRILSKNVSSLGTRLTVMIPIDEEEEELIDNIDKSVLKFHRGHKTFSVSMRDIYCYGEVDFEDEDTLVYTVTALFIEADPYFSTFRGVLDGIGDAVEENLIQSHFIHINVFM